MILLSKWTRPRVRWSKIRLVGDRKLPGSMDPGTKSHKKGTLYQTGHFERRRKRWWVDSFCANNQTWFFQYHFPKMLKIISRRNFLISTHTRACYKTKTLKKQTKPCIFTMQWIAEHKIKQDLSDHNSRFMQWSQAHQNPDITKNERLFKTRARVWALRGQWTPLCICRC